MNFTNKLTITSITPTHGPGGDYDTTYTSKVFASGLNNPQFIALDSSGNFFVTNFGDGTVSKITANGTVTTFATGLGLPQGIAVDGKGNLYVAGNLPFDRSFRLLLSGDR